MSSGNGYSHSWQDFQDLIEEARKRGFDRGPYTCFVESGTFLGQTVIPLAHRFREVHTIEIKPECFEAAKLFSWKAKAPIHFHLGATEEVLSSLVARLKRHTVFYLDAHFSGGISGGEDHEVPLLQELGVIAHNFFRHAGLVVIDDLGLFGKLHKFDDWSSCTADWRGITEEAVLGCFQAGRVAGAFAVPGKDCYVICLEPRDAPPRPPPDTAFRVARGGSSTGQAHWVSAPGRALDTEALAALRGRGAGWNDVANLISLEYQNQHMRSGRAFPGQAPGSPQPAASAPAADAHVVVGTWNQWNSEDSHGFQDPASRRPAAAPAPPPTPAEAQRKRRPKVVLSRQEAMNMELELVARFEDPGFQQELRTAWAAAGDDKLKQMQARMEVCLPIQTEVIAKYGFEPTRQGVAQSVYTVRALFLEDKEIMDTAGHLVNLVDPTLH